MWIKWLHKKINLIANCDTSVAFNFIVVMCDRFIKTLFI